MLVTKNLIIPITNLAPLKIPYTKIYWNYDFKIDLKRN